MTKVMHIAALFAWVCLMTLSSRTTAQDNFTLALRDRSTSPRLLLVTVEYADLSQRVIMTGGTQLLIALMKERGFEKWDNAYRVAETAALAGRDRPFRFTKPGVLKMLEIPYTLELLAEIRKKLSGFATPELRSRLDHPDGFQDIYPPDPKQKSRYKLAIAHVLLEMGIPVQQNCLDGSLGLAR